jgi:hypothetical protein
MLRQRIEFGHQEMLLANAPQSNEEDSDKADTLPTLKRRLINAELKLNQCRKCFDEINTLLMIPERQFIAQDHAQSQDQSDRPYYHSDSDMSQASLFVDPMEETNPTAHNTTPDNGNRTQYGSQKLVEHQTISEKLGTHCKKALGVETSLRPNDENWTSKMPTNSNNLGLKSVRFANAQRFNDKDAMLYDHSKISSNTFGRSMTEPDVKYTALSLNNMVEKPPDRGKRSRTLRARDYRHIPLATDTVYDVRKGTREMNAATQTAFQNTARFGRSNGKRPSDG